MAELTVEAIEAQIDTALELANAGACAEALDVLMLVATTIGQVLPQDENAGRYLLEQAKFVKQRFAIQCLKTGPRSHAVNEVEYE